MWQQVAPCGGLPSPWKRQGQWQAVQKGKSKGKFRKGKSKGKGKFSGKGSGKYRSQKGSWNPGRSSSWCPRYFVNYDEDDYEEPNQLRHARLGLRLGDSPPKEPPRPQARITTAQHFDIKEPPGTKSDYFEDLLRLERAGKTPTAVSSDEAPSSTADPATDTQAAMPSNNLTFFSRKSDERNENEEETRHCTYHGQPESSDIYHTVGGRRRRGLIIDPGAANGLIGTETLRDLLQHVDKARQVNETLVWRPKKSEVTGISGAADTTLGEVTMALPMIPGLESAQYKADVIGGEASMCPALVGNPALVNMKAVLASKWFSNKDGLLIIPDGESDMHLIRLLFTDSRHYLLPLDSENDAAQTPDDIAKAKTFLSRAAERSRKRWSDVNTWFMWATTPRQKRSHEESGYLENEHDASHFADTDKDDHMHHKESNDNHGTDKSGHLEEKFPTSVTTTPSDSVIDSGAHADQNIIEEKFPTSTTTPCDKAIDSGPKDSNSIPLVVQDQPVYETQRLTNEILASASLEAPFDTPSPYPGDRYPPDLPDHKRQKLDRQRRAINEEFYTKSGYNPVTPENFHQWRQTSKAKKRMQFWEICSGSGRLSYIALLAGLSVAFPVDFRYGWNLGNAKHQDMLLEAQQRLQPDVIMVSPSCGPWSTSANRLSTEEDGQESD